MTMAAYNPDERDEIPRIGVPIIGIGKVPFINIFGEIDRAYEVRETDEPNMLWEDGRIMSWENGENILLEQQLVRVWH